MMEGKTRPWNKQILPLSFWSSEHTNWMDIALPMALQPQQEIWLDIGRVMYGLAEFHFSCEEICLVHMRAAETLAGIEEERAEEYEYKGQGRYPVMLGQQVLRFIRLRVHKPCFLMNLFLWAREEPVYPASPMKQMNLQSIWQNACSVVSFCWQEGLWMRPSMRAWANVYSVWILGPCVFSLAGSLHEWKNDLLSLLEQYEQKEWLADSPMASLWFFLCLNEYYQFSKDEDFFERQGSRIKSRLEALLQNCRSNGRIQYPLEPEGNVWHRLFRADSEEILMAQQSAFFWVMSEIKHLIFHLGWMEQFVKIEHFLALREEFWLFPQSAAGAALAVLADLPDRRFYFLPKLRQYHHAMPPVEIILLVLALMKKNEAQAAMKIVEEYWPGKSALYPPVAENPYRAKKSPYMLCAWDAAPINLMQIFNAHS